MNYQENREINRWKERKRQVIIHREVERTEAQVIIHRADYRMKN